MTYDPEKIAVRDGWALVLDDPRKTVLQSGILLPGHETGVEKVTEGAGQLIHVGLGNKSKIAGLEKGQRIVYRAFLKWANRIPTDLKWESGEEKHYFVMSIDDIMGIVGPGVDVGVFSGRPQVKERA